MGFLTGKVAVVTMNGRSKMLAPRSAAGVWQSGLRHIICSAHTDRIQKKRTVYDAA
jgi:hypothetical protein